MSDARSWYLLADVGGTNARFALADMATGTVQESRSLFVAEHPTFNAALEAYLAQIAAADDWKPRPDGGCLAVACPTDREVITFTNSDWVIDRVDAARLLGLQNLHLVNDFESIGYAVSALSECDWQQIGKGDAVPGRPLGVIGAGTGLGVCTVVPGERGPIVLPGEGGHVDFSPVGEEEVEIQRVLLQRYRRVSAERLLSGAGLQNIYWALAELRGGEQRAPSPADITAAATAGSEPLARGALSVFCRVLGGVAGNLALTLGARGGIYIAGGIAPRILDFLAASDFRERFLAKGRFRDYLGDIPTRVVTLENPGLVGALRCLQSRS